MQMVETKRIKNGYPKSNLSSNAPSQHPGFLVRNVQVFRNTLDEKYI